MKILHTISFLGISGGGSIQSVFYTVKELPYTLEKRQKIRDWAMQNISGEAAARYFEETVEYVYNKNGQRPVAPWLK
ncbi:MAG: hypothetical protein LBS50_07560 [Prevotellaceae bacterium]|jgi:hypothetical protein|nr:hypothetical protein [Prevotellaceae bacterium]